MRASRLVVIASSLALVAACGRATPHASPSADERRKLVDDIGRRLEAHYVSPEMGARMAASLREHASRGDYDTATEPADFAKIVTEHLRDVSHDRHAMLEWTPSAAARTPEEEQRARLAALHRQTAGFGATEWLPGNVARLVIDSFEPIQAARDAVTKHLAEIADADALLVDLRDNHGGDPATVALVASYLFDATPVHLNDMWWRDDGSTDAFFTTPDVPGKRFGATKPVFVLTSRDTFSAAEELAYDLQCLHRASIIGETTKGGAHPVAPQKLSPSLTLRVPTGRAVNPITKTNWEGTGVTPDTAVAASAAVREAHARALHAILAEPDVTAARRQSAQSALDALDGSRAP